MGNIISDAIDDWKKRQLPAFAEVIGDIKNKLISIPEAIKRGKLPHSGNVDQTEAELGLISLEEYQKRQKENIKSGNAPNIPPGFSIPEFSFASFAPSKPKKEAKPPKQPKAAKPPKPPKQPKAAKPPQEKKPPAGVGPGGIRKGSYPPQSLTQEQRQWLWEQFGHTGQAPVGYGGESGKPPKAVKPPKPPKQPKAAKPPKPPKQPKAAKPPATIKVTPEVLKSYPHMFPRDVSIWQKFLKSYSTAYESFNYDVRIGVGTKPIEGQKDAYTKMQQVLSQYRIDAVGLKAQQIDIIEVKPQATVAAIGQVLSYARIYVRDFSPTQPVIPTIVTNYEMPDMRYLTRVLSIQYIIV